jgi:hypothetical protein
MSFQQEFPRTRDCYTLFKGDAYGVSISQTMAAQGWQGGQGVMWVDSPQDEFLVTCSDGIYGGFMLWGSNEDSDRYTSLTAAQPLYGLGVFCAGGWLISTRTVELETWRSRHGLEPPGTPIVYNVGERVLFSLRGYWTKEDEWWLSGDPRGHNTFYVGSVVQAPSADTDYQIVIQTSI